MIYEAKAFGATIEEARANAIAALNAPETADVHTEVLAMPVKKVLGLFGGKKAEARAFYEVPDAPKKDLSKKSAAPKADAPVKKDQKPQQKKPADKKPEQKAKAPQAPKNEPKKPDAPKAEPKKAEASLAPEVRTPISIEGKPGVMAAAAYLIKIVEGMGVAKASVEPFLLADNEVLLELDCGEDYGIVIGRRGETLDSIQYLTRLVANKVKNDGEYSRISVNVGNYREKRKTTLANLARKNADKVLKYGRDFKFEPMNPYERRIIHTTVQEIEGVTSHSVGSDEARRVVITLADGVKPSHPSKGGGNRGNRGGNNRNRGGRGGNRGPRPQQTTAPTRAPKTDAGAEGFSLYGKLN
ncbi:MAG: KH domain-containing protein [Clostridia bacterium]|nr:KH domain-containing protein [Clostridia bacterium]